MNRSQQSPRLGLRAVLAAALGAVLVGAVLLAGAAPAAAEALQVDPKLPAYRKVGGVSGNMNSIGSDTLNNLMALWAETFRRAYPNVNIQIEGKGSSTAPPALIEGTSQLGPMSRTMKSSEKEGFEKKFGYEPTPIVVAFDTLAVFVHKDNPIRSLSLPEVDAIFSKNRRRGFGKNIDTWGDLGLNGSWRNLPVSLYGRNSASGTYGYFKEHALGKGDFKDTVKEQPGSASVVQGVETDRGAVGYSGIGYRTSGVRALPLAKKVGQTAYQPTYENALNGKYTLSRPLLVYVNKHPSKGLDKLTKEFLALVLSKEGQEVVIKDGYLPLPAAVAAKQRALLN